MIAAYTMILQSKQKIGRVLGRLSKNIDDSGPSVQTMDSAIHGINHCPVDKPIALYPVDSDLSVESVIHLLNDWGLISVVL